MKQAAQPFVKKAAQYMEKKAAQSIVKKATKFMEKKAYQSHRRLAQISWWAQIGVLVAIWRNLGALNKSKP